MSYAKIVERRRATREEWLTCWEACDYATYFQSPMWGEVWEAYSQGVIKSNADLIRLDNGAQYIVPFGEVFSFKGALRHTHMSQAGTYGGVIAENSSPDSEVMNHIISVYDNVTLRGNPYLPLELDLSKKNDVSQVIDLKELTDDIKERWSTSHKRSLKKAIKSNVNIELATTEQQWDEYFEIYLKSLERWSDKATIAYRRNLFSLLKSQENLSLWVAIIDKKIVGGAIMLYSKRNVIYWHGASDQEYYDKRPIHLLFYQMIADAKHRNLSYFDFNPSGGIEGVERFKSGFGATYMDAPIWEKESMKSRILGKFRSFFFK
ncbi:MAG: GNAT family N-acetyltransferase [Cytophagales bacterium]|nr:GNAT family N-acetyltransferase [Cytophagales bacterium]